MSKISAKIDARHGKDTAELFLNHDDAQQFYAGSEESDIVARAKLIRFRQLFDTIGADHRVAQSLQSWYAHPAVAPAAQSTRCPSPGDSGRCDSDQDIGKLHFALLLRQRKPICANTRISMIRKIVPNENSCWAFGVATEQASHLHLLRNDRNDSQNLVSRSMIKCCLPLRNPSSQLVSSRAVCFTQASCGLVVQPEK